VAVKNQVYGVLLAGLVAGVSGTAQAAMFTVIASNPGPVTGTGRDMRMCRESSRNEP
jgi:hypothetical protein